jgi:hypothetical protein
VTTLELGKNGSPSGRHRSLKMNGLNADQRQGSAAGKNASGARAGRVVNVFLESAAEPSLFVGIDFSKRHKVTVKNILGFGAQNIGEAAGHAGAEIETERAEDDGDAAGHVLATVLANAFDHGESAAVANGKALPSASGDEKLAGGRAVKDSVAGENVAAAGSGESSRDGDGAAGKSLADVIVGLAGEADGYTFGEKCAEALAGGAMKILADFVITAEAILSAAHEFAAEAGAHAAIGVLYGLNLVLEAESGVEMERFFEGSDVEGGLLLGCDAIGGRDRHDEERVHAGAGAEAVVPAGEIAERTNAELR